MTFEAIATGVSSIYKATCSIVLLGLTVVKASGANCFQLSNYSAML